MKKIYIFILCLGILPYILFCCKEETTDLRSEFCFVKSSKNGSYTYSYDYDIEERVIKLITKNELNSEEFYKVYDYSKTGEVRVMRNDSLAETLITLNLLGNAISRRDINYSSRKPIKIASELITTYEYDGNEYLTKEIITYKVDGQEYISSYTYNFVDGNLKDLKYKPATGSERTWQYTYESSYDNSLGKFERKSDFKGKKSKHLIKTREEIIVAGTPIVENFSYTFDGNGNVTSQTITSVGNPDFVTNLTWECN